MSIDSDSAIEGNRQAARRALPNVPAQIFETWLDDCIERNGWPPKGPAWEGILLKRPLSFWRNVNWRQEALSVGLAELTPDSAGLVTELLEHTRTHRPPSFLSWIPGHSRATIQWHVNRLRSDGEHIAPPILLRTVNGFAIADGHHRMVASSILATACNHQFWIGESAGI